jgi:DNA-binding MarR family transcriptional regulator
METSTIDYLLQHTSIMMYRQADQTLQERLGIGMSQYKLLVFLQDHPDAGQRLIADSLGQTEASISRQIKLLTEKDIVETAVNPESRREHRVILTVRGTRLTNAARDILEQSQNSVYDRFSTKQRQQFKDMLTALHDHTCQEGRSYACNHSFMV